MSMKAKGWSLESIAGLGIVGGAALVGLASLLWGCGGWSDGHGGVDYVYVATGAAIGEYAVSGDGQLTPIFPAAVVSGKPVAIAVSSDNRFAYAADQSNGTIAQYSVSSSGALGALAPASVVSGAGVNSVALTPDGTHAYALNATADTISEFSIGSDGTLTALAPATAGVSAGGNGLAVSPNSAFLYATSNSANKLSAYAVASDGQLSLIATYTVPAPSAPAVSPSGAYLYCADSTNGVRQFAINQDGTLTPLSPAVVATGGQGNDALALSPDGKFCYAGVNAGSSGSPIAQFSVGADGGLTALNPPSVPAGNAPVSVAVTRGGGYLYAVNGSDGTVSEFLIGSGGGLVQLDPSTVKATGALSIAVARK